MIAKLNSKNQITLPSNMRKKLNIQAGDHLLVAVQDGVMLLIPQPKSYTGHMQGLHAEIWKHVGAQKYLNVERGSWEQKKVK